MPAFRKDLERIPVYRPGKPIAEVSRELGLDQIVKLASNEWPSGPFPEVADAIAAAVDDLNRYPENSAHHLVEVLAAYLGVEPENLWMGAGSTELLLGTSLAVGGPGTSTVFADPSFVMYPIAAAIAGSEAIPVPCNEGMGHDLNAMLAAIRPDTSLVFVCNPNNPTGTWLDHDSVQGFIDAIPPETLVVVDEAYFEFATDPSYGTAIGDAVSRSNVLVSRTFSKVFGLAGLRVGYMVGQPETLAQLRRAQVPFSVNSIAQVAAEAAIAHADRVGERVADNQAWRDQLEGGLAELGIEYVPSQTNFILTKPARDTAVLSDGLLRRGVIVRPMGPFLRITVGTKAENEMLLEGLAALTS